MFDITFLDFDETLFHTQDFKNDMAAVFKRYGVPDKVFWQTLSSTENDGHGMTYFDYTFEKHIKTLEEQGFSLSDELLRDLLALLERSYIFEDAKEFISWIKSHSKQVLILSSGSQGFQMMKIRSTGFDKLVNDVLIFHDHKEEVVKTLIKNDDQVLFVNDNLIENKRVKEALSQVKVVSRINTFKFPEADYRASGIPCFYTLSEIQTYVEQTII